MSHRFIPWDWPDFVAAAIGQVGGCQDERSRDWVMRVYPHVLVERASELSGAWKHVLPCVSERSPILLSRAWANMYVQDAIGLRERVAESSFTMPVLATWLHGMMTNTQDLEVIDWLNALPEIDPPLLNRLDRMTWAQAEERSRRWHAAMAKKKAISAGTDGTADRVDSHDGHYWVRLVSEAALDRESDAMGHCVGRGGYDRYAALPVERGGIWSLRDAKGKGVLTAHLIHDSVEDLRRAYLNQVGLSGSFGMVRPEIGREGRLRVGQISGPRNRAVQGSEVRHLMTLRAFYSYLEMPITPEVVTSGWEVIDDRRKKERGIVQGSQHFRITDELGKEEFRQEDGPRLPEIFTYPVGKGLPDPDRHTDESIAISQHLHPTIHHLADGVWHKLFFDKETRITVGESSILVQPVERGLILIRLMRHQRALLRRPRSPIPETIDVFGVHVDVHHRRNWKAMFLVREAGENQRDRMVDSSTLRADCGIKIHMQPERLIAPRLPIHTSLWGA